ncbi:arrestin domain-containing protein 3-like [Thrips palmi]|uniref:Arrestin domain-containing protein 3-like n=1 Tax=Thrips palmi TaxID=161013 RepID=A0A6P8Z720_THRPL|nr:arrestin domain-containing protein 3-like [Thrips palmi]XP_034245831.1 arrestin domain-containing protein 3-like [Thrips palmi]
MSVTLRIHFDRPNAVYFPGELVTGRVFLNVSRPKKVRAFSIQLRGLADVKWTESKSKSNSHGSSSSETETYSATETYFDNKVYFLGGATGEVEISPGDHVYNFECMLPRVVPSSFEGVHGSIRYTATAAMHRPWKFDHTAKAAFTVISHLDLNNRPQAREPVSASATKHFCCCFCKSGPLSVDVHLPTGGYVPGQVILGQIQVDNASSTRVQRVLCALVKRVTYYASGSTNKSNVTVAATMFDGAVETHDSKVISLVMPVPAVPPSNLEHCKIIDLQYALTVTAEVPGIRFNLHCVAPILVGTIPVFVEDGWNRANTSGPALASASAPPMYSQSDFPPPSYEESVLKGNNIIDPTDKYTMGKADFTPRYPVWAFSNPSFER